MTSSSDAYRSPIARVVHVRCGYGGSGVSAPGYCAISPYFDVTALHAITDLRVTAIELFDGASGAGVASAAGPTELRIWLPGPDRGHSEPNAPFSGAIDAGATLRLFAVTDFTLPPSTAESRCRYRLALSAFAGAATSANFATFEVEGPLDDPWATAGPAPRE